MARACFLSEAEGDTHYYDQGKVKWLNVSMAACRGQVSMGMSDSSAHAGRVPGCLELGLALCVHVGIRMSQCVCVQEDDSVPVHLQQMTRVSAQRFGLGQEQKEGHCAPWQCVRVIQVSFHL